MSTLHRSGISMRIDGGRVCLLPLVMSTLHRPDFSTRDEGSLREENDQNIRVAHMMELTLYFSLLHLSGLKSCFDLLVILFF